MAQITTVTFFKYNNSRDKLWAFVMMQKAHKYLSHISGQLFYKLMGSGKGRGFNPLPDWSVYALIQVWETEKEARDFLRDHALMGKYRNRAIHCWSIFMKPIMARGKWSGKEPFTPHNEADPDNPVLAVITRASIKWSKMIRFWSFVPKSQKPLEDARGLIYTKGVGEAPLVQMATFSIWDNGEALHKFAYGSQEHKKAIHLTRTLGWYKEELFARFQPYMSMGSWVKGNPLAGKPGITILDG